MKIKSEKIIEIIKLSDASECHKQLMILSDDEKEEFAKLISVGILKNQLLSGSPVAQSFVKSSSSSIQKATTRISLIEGIKKVTAWLKTKAITWKQVAESEEFKAAFGVLMDENARESHMEVAADLIRLVICAIDFKNPEFEERFFNQILKIPVNFKFEKSRIICKIFVALGEKFMSKIILDGHYSCKIVSYILSATGHPETTQSTFPFWRSLAEKIKNSENSKFSPILEDVMIRCANYLKDMKLIIDKKDENLENSVLTFIEDIVESKVFKSQKAFEYFSYMLYQPGVALEDAEISLLFLVKFAINIEVTDNFHVPLLIEDILNNPRCQFTPQFIKILGNLGKWLAVHSDMLKAVLDYLASFLTSDEADLAATAMKLICYDCKNLMIPFFDGFYQIFIKFGETKLSDEGQRQIIKGISEIISRLPQDQIEIATRELLRIQLEKIFAFGALNPVKHLDQLAEVISCINIEEAGKVFIEYWPVVSQMLHTCQSNEILVAIIEVLKCAVNSYELELLPILEDMIEKSLLVCNLETSEMTLRFIINVLKVINNRYSCASMKIFEATCEIIFTILGCESNFKAEIVEKFFEFANFVAEEFPLQLMRSPFVIPSIELAIQTCRIDNDTTAIEFISTLLTVENVNSLDYQREIMSIYGERLIFNLLLSYLLLPEPSKLNYICDIFFVMKSTSNEATCEILEKSLRSITNRNRNFNGKIVMSENTLKEFLTAMSHPNTTKQLMVNNMSTLKNSLKL